MMVAGSSPYGKCRMNPEHLWMTRCAGRALGLTAAIAAVLALVATPALAATDTWTGIGGGCFPGANSWSKGACWSSGSPPNNGDDVVIAQFSPASPDNYDINRTLNSITFSNDTIALTVSNAGGTLGLQSGGFVTDNNTNLDALNTGVTLNGPATFTLSSGASGLSFGGSAITGTGGLTLVNNSGNDALQLTVADTYTGSTTVNGTGEVLANINGAIPTGSALTVNGKLKFGASSTIGSLAGGGTALMNGSNTLTVGGDNSNTIFSGSYQNSGGSAALSKTGSGTLTLASANTYTGATTVNSGTLAVNGSLTSAVTVNAGGRLGGTGTISNAVTVNSGGTLSPGNSPGIINTGSVTLTGGSTLAIKLNGPTVGTQYDQVNVTGTVALGGATLNVLLGFTPTAGQVFTIINNDGIDPVTGTFTGLGEGGTFTAGGHRFRISYVGGTGNDVTLTAADVPPTIAKAFGVGSIPLNGTTTLTFNIANSNSATSLTGVGFSDTLPAGLVVATPNGLSGSCGGGTITATAGSSSVSLSGATLAASASCSFTVNVTGTSAGTKNNMTGAVTSNEGGSGGAASASLDVAAAVAAIPALSSLGLLLLGLAIAALGAMRLRL
jgi:fibronectin-binding autotransporter adhesin